MKIITRLKDEELLKLYETYNFDNLMIQYESDSQGTLQWYYVIPPELVLEDNYYSDYNHVNKLDGGIVYCRCAGKFIKLFTGLTIQEYFDILVLHINDTDDRPRCANCGKFLEFKNISCGYGSHHGWDFDSIHNFCSQKCNTTYTACHEDEYPAIKLRNEDSNLKYLSTLDKLTAKCNSFYAHGNNDDPSEFYIANSREDIFKYGVTDNIQNRDTWHGDYKNIKSIFKGTRQQVAELEFNLGVLLDTPTEYIGWDRVFDFIRCYPIALNKMLSEFPDQK